MHSKHKHVDRDSSADQCCEKLRVMLQFSTSFNARKKKPLILSSVYSALAYSIMEVKHEERRMNIKSVFFFHFTTRKRIMPWHQRQCTRDNRSMFWSRYLPKYDLDKLDAINWGSVPLVTELEDRSIETRPSHFLSHHISATTEFPVQSHVHSRTVRTLWNVILVSFHKKNTKYGTTKIFGLLIYKCR